MELRPIEPYNRNPDNPMGDDGPLLLAMLIPLTPEEATARIERLDFVAHGGGAATHWSRDLEASPESEPIWIAFKNVDREIVARLRHDWIGPGAIRAGWAPYAWVRKWEDGSIRDVFACRNWNETTALCDTYHQRPWLCRHYPDAGDPGDEAAGDQIPRGATTW